jgi:hypothetical protein
VGGPRVKRRFSAQLWKAVPRGPADFNRLRRAAVDEIVAKRMVKKQQMRWNPDTVQKCLDVRVHVLNGTLEMHFDIGTRGLGKSWNRFTSRSQPNHPQRCMLSTGFSFGEAQPAPRVGQAIVRVPSMFDSSRVKVPLST